jgi:hypothetical protein
MAFLIILGAVVALGLTGITLMAGLHIQAKRERPEKKRLIRVVAHSGVEEKVFGLLPPPDNRHLVRYKGLIQIFITGLMIMFITMGVNVFDPDPGGSLFWVISLWFMLGTGILLGGLLGWYYLRNRKSNEERFRETGLLGLTEEGLRICHGPSDEERIPFSDIERMDLFFHEGLEATDPQENMDPFERIKTMRIRLQTKEGERELFVKNNEAGTNELGSLFDAIQEIKKSDTESWKKIQFWNKY